MQKPWHLGKSPEVLLRKKKKKSFAETLKRSPTAARMGRERAPGPGPQWGYLWLRLSRLPVELFHFVSHRNQATWNKASVPVNRMESANTSDPGGSVTGFSRQKYWAPGEQIYTEIVVVYLKFKFNSRLSFFSQPHHMKKRGSALWFYRSALIRPLDQAPTLGAPLE